MPVAVLRQTVTQPKADPPTWKHAALLLAVGGGLVVLGVAPPTDRLTWLMENLPVMIAVPLLVCTYRRFPLSMLGYCLIAVHAFILMIGGHYSYAAVPAGFWVRDALHLARNPYDRLGHVAQGFVPFILGREILIRTGTLPRGWVLNVLVLSLCLAISALYELVEWGAALVMGQAADQFLGTQADMACALAGAAAALLLGPVHDRSMAQLGRHNCGAASLSARPPDLGRGD
jgi:putative membrane protein